MMDIEERMQQVDFSGLSKIRDSLLQQLLKQQREHLPITGLHHEELALDDLDLVTAARGLPYPANPQKHDN